MENRNKKYILFIVLAALTVVVVFTGVLFSSRNFKGYCYNHTDSELNSQIVNTVRSEYENKSIFLVSESDLKAKLERKFPSVEIVGIERIFPDAIKVNYVVKKNYAYAISDGVYKYVSKDCKVLDSDGGEIASSSQLIKITTDESTVSGDKLFDAKGYTASYLYTMLDIMERMGFKSAEQMIEEVDFTRIKADLIVIKWRTGAHVHVEYPDRNFEKKIQLAVSAITSCEESKRTSGIWRVYSDKISYAKN
ncbi:MAG: FtsQ-type POTRA domain-containing protein [Clostridia bacterium]|nr:FtsQ-type POTRA domain-containing protein [Clostridia bacterium]